MLEEQQRKMRIRWEHSPRAQRLTSDFKPYGVYAQCIQLYRFWKDLKIGTDFEQWLSDCAWVNRKRGRRPPPLPVQGEFTEMMHIP